jgi:Flp pilus assembly protein TadD
MTALNAHPLAPADLWLAGFHQDPPQALERFLLERVYMGRLERHDPDEILYRLFHSAGKKALASLDAAMRSWFVRYLLTAPPDFSASHWALILQNAFSAVARLNLGQSQDYLRENLRRARAWLRGLYQGPDRDPEAHFLRVLALSQRDRDLLPLWMRLCRLEEDRPLHYAPLGLLGLQFLPDAQGRPPGDLDDAMFVALRDLADAIERQAPDKKEGKTFWVLQVRALRARFPRSQEYWTEHFFPLVQQEPRSAAARWMSEIVPRLKSALKPGGPRPDTSSRSLPPTPQQKKSLLHQLQTFPLAEVQPRVEAFINAHASYARRTGDAEELVRALGQLSAKIYRSDPRWALEMVEQAFRWERHNPHNWMRLAQIAFFCGRRDQAARVLWEAVRLFPENERLKNNLARVLESQGRHDLAEALLRQVMTEFPQNEVCRNVLAQALMAQGRFDEAEKVARNAMAKFPTNEVCRNVLAQALMAQDRFKEAEEVAREAMAEFPQNAFFHNVLAQALMAQGRFKEADEVARDAMAVFPKNEVYRTILKKILEAQGQGEAIAPILPECDLKTAMVEMGDFLQTKFPPPTPAALEEDDFLEPEMVSQKPCFLDSQEKPSLLATFENGGRGQALAAQASIYRQAARRASVEEKPRYQQEAALVLKQALAAQRDDPQALLEQGYWLLEFDPGQAENFFQEWLSKGLQPNVLGFRLGYLRALKRQGKATPKEQWEELRDRFFQRRTLILLEQALEELGQSNGTLLGALQGLKNRLHGRLEAVPNPLKNNEKWVRDRVRDQLFAHLDKESEISEAVLPQIRKNFNQFGLVLQGMLEQSLAAQLAD